MCYKCDIKETTTLLVMYSNKLDIIVLSSDNSHDCRNAASNFAQSLNKELYQNKVFSRSLQDFLNIIA